LCIMYLPSGIMGYIRFKLGRFSWLRVPTPTIPSRLVRAKK
jgi:hypothetical protein